ncbi:M15 family metallopeptidase [uncultured Croceitalea sp.]|uniref:M15 family metallopeptidase n=1 Tax=uncultured Croceitalea sp. TaxID=1798908 RepID=UPI0033064CB1
MNTNFSILKLSEERKKAITSCIEWSQNCPISLDMLRQVNFQHYDFEGNIKSGVIIVHTVIADKTLTLFKKLFKIKFPIHQAIPIDEYKGSDIDSMKDNNTSGFNCRRVMGENKWSSHAYGAAIDINPLQNPYVLINHNLAEAKIFPKNGTMFLNRSIQRDGMVESIVTIFKNNGFSIWGGDWNTVLDYHHFQISWDEINKIIS